MKSVSSGHKSIVLSLPIAFASELARFAITQMQSESV